MLRKLKLINILLILLAIPVSAFLLKDILIYRYNAPQNEIPSAPKQTEAASPELRAYAPIIEKTLFASSAKQLTAIDMVEAGGDQREGMTSSMGDIKLVGTYVGRESFAVFEKTGKQEAFRKGENVFEAGKLKDVSGDKAVVSSGARDVTFTVPREPSPRSGEAAPVVGGSPNELPVEEPPQEPAAQPVPISKKLGDNQWVISQSALLHSLDKMGQILTDARLTPRLLKGAVEGFMVTEIKPKGVFGSIGLKNGDILTRVNGYDIDSPEKAVQVLSGLKGESMINLDIIRSGKNLSFHYDIR